MWHTADSDRGSGALSFDDTGVRAGIGRQHLMRVLDEIDYGMLIIDARGAILHANHLARHELANGRIVKSHGNHLLGSSTAFTAQIQEAIDTSFRGQRKLLMMSSPDRELSLSFTPLSHPLEADSPSVLVLMSRQNSADNLSVHLFAQSLNLSRSEEAVLVGLCRGLQIPEIARLHRVADSTVRSQIKTLREKAGVASIRILLQRVNSLPPVVPALHILTPMPHNATEFSHP